MWRVMQETSKEKKRKFMNDRLCITGMGVVSSIGIGKEEFLLSLKNGQSGITEIKAFDTHFSRSKKGGVIRAFSRGSCSSTK